jgi:hypothetical protein
MQQLRSGPQLGRITAVALALCAATTAASSAQTPDVTLTYVLNVESATANAATSTTSTLRISAGDARTATIVAPNGAPRQVALDGATSASISKDPALQCYALVSNLLPDAMRLSPGMEARGGELTVTAGTQAATVAVNFAAEALAPQLERVYVYADSTAPVQFAGSIDFSGGVLVAATYAVATADHDQSFQARKCTIGLVVPNQDQPQPANAIAS